MLAKAAAKVPDEAGLWSYEPKWDGFRALVFRDGDEVVLTNGEQRVCTARVTIFLKRGRR